MKRILGLDLGTNSIGWALVDSEEQRILGMGSRIIPMDQGVLDTFSGGNPVETQTAAGRFIIKSRGNRSSLSSGIKMLANGVAV